MLRSIKKFFIILIRFFSGSAFFAFSLFLFLSLITYEKLDPSLNVVTSKKISNLCSYFGSYTSDFLFMYIGISAFFIPFYFLSLSIKIIFFENSKVSQFKMTYFLVLLISSNFLISMIYTGNNYRIYGAFTMMYAKYLSTFEEKYFSIIRSLIIAIFLFAFDKTFDLNKIKNFLLKKFSHLINRSENSNNCYLEFEEEEILNSYEEKDIENKDNKTFKNFDLNNFGIENKLNNKEKSKAFKELSKKSENRKFQKYSHYEFNNLLSEPTNIENDDFIDEEFYKEQSILLTKILKDFGISGAIINYKIGPVVVLYEFEPSAGIKSSRVIGLSDDIARFMKVVSTRISVIIGKSALGIEVPKKTREFFCLKEIIRDKKFLEPKLPLALGKSICGEPVIADLYSMPHLLIAGTTGSGKSVSINTIIISLLLKHSPQTCRMIMIDPKMLELSVYNDIPHLITPVVTDPKKAIGVLQWLVKEMEERYRTISCLGVRNICKYNEKIRDAIKEGTQLEKSIQTGFDSNTGDPIFENIKIEMKEMPFIVVFVDEMADLMLVSGKDVEMTIQRLSQMARAAGIHLILSTQRPSVDVITGVIKANLPTRISFSVSSKIDSRTIIGEQGAEQLLRMGDMLYMYEGKISRVHGPFVDDNEVHNIVKYLKEFDKPKYIESVDDFCEKLNIKKDKESEICLESNDIYEQAVAILKNEEKISISYLQRKLRIGYNKAANIIEKMEEEGIIGPPNRSGKREIICS